MLPSSVVVQKVGSGVEVATTDSAASMIGIGSDELREKAVTVGSSPERG
jgi:hypothetical protein